jgi:hypothetical protein
MVHLFCSRGMVNDDVFVASSRRQRERGREREREKERERYNIKEGKGRIPSMCH